jgi:hypothetical protein
MRALILSLILACVVCSYAVPAEEIAGRFLGLGYDDPSGDSPYGPLMWCGERLWVETNSGQKLVDPASATVLWQQDGPGLSLFSCTGEGAGTVFWFDDFENNQIVWNSMDGRQRGNLRGFARSDDTGWPMIVIGAQQLVSLVDSGNQLTASSLPAGLAAVAVPRDQVSALVEGDVLNDFKVLKPGVIELDSFRNGMDMAIILRVDVQGGKGEVRQSWTLEDLLEDLLLSPIVGVDAWPRLEQDGSLSFAIMKRREMSVAAAIQKCTVVGIDDGAPRATCQPATPVADAEIARQQRSGRCAFCYGNQTAPSGRWTAWMKEAPFNSDDDIGKVELYVAPTADLLKP